MFDQSSQSFETPQDIRQAQLGDTKCYSAVAAEAAVAADESAAVVAATAGTVASADAAALAAAGSESGAAFAELAFAATAAGFVKFAEHLEGTHSPA